jgi:hypothetical protein
MIENALLHSILDIIFKQIKQPWLVPQDNCRFDPFMGIIGNQEMG